MDAALDSLGRLIRAEDAPRGVRYQCPECKVRVRLNRGIQRVAHFKHSPDSEADQRCCDRCSLYISVEGASPQAPTLPKPRVRPPAKASLAVGWKPSSDAPERWSLYVSVPLPPLGVEQVLVEGNINGEIWVNRRAIEKQRYVPVRVAAKQYSCRHRPSVTTAGGYYVVHPTERLESDRANVFAVGTSGGAQLECNEPLIRGRCYFSLSKKPDIWRPLPRDTSRVIPGSRDCDPQGAWQGHLFYVPMSADRQFDAWCQGVCKRNVVAPPDDFELLYPPLLDTRPDGTLVVPHGEPLVFALSGGWDQPEIEIWRDDVVSGATVERLSAFEGGRVSITNLPEGLFSIYATETRRVLVRVEVTVPVEPTISAFSICTQDLSTGEELRGDLHHQDGAARWSGLMSGAECWGWIDFPQGWPVRFCHRLRNEKQDRSQSVTTSTELARLIAGCLAADPLTAGVDAGIFGKALWEAPKPAQPSRSLHQDIPHRLRQRIDWLLANTAIQSEARAIPVGISLPSGWDARLARQDIAAVAKFLKTQRWPVSLVVHARSVAKELCDNLKT